MSSEQVQRLTKNEELMMDLQDAIDRVIEGPVSELDELQRSIKQALADALKDRTVAEAENERLRQDRELIERLFSNDGVHGGWPDATEDEPSDWERWVLRLHGLEAGDYLEGDNALRHIRQGLWFTTLKEQGAQDEHS